MTSPTTSQALVRKSQDAQLMPPPPPVKRIKRPAQVLDEDEYTDALSHIIARDYFPGLLETEAKQDYLDALQSKDQEWIARAGRQLEEVMTPGPKKRGRRGVSMTPRTSRSTTRETPAATPKGWIGDTPVSVAGSDAKSEVSQEPKDQAQSHRPEIANMTLGAFQAKFTSEDNESFNKLLDKQNEKRRERYAWLWNDNKIPSARQIAHRKRELKRIEAQASSSSADDNKQLIKTDLDARPARPDAWKANPRNALMFEPDSIEDTHETLQQKAEAESRADSKQILHQNTRIQPNIEEAIARPPSPTTSAIHDAIAGKPRRTGSDAGYLGSETPRLNGYSFVDEDEPEPEPEARVKHDQEYYMNLLTSEGIDTTPSPFMIRGNRRREELHHRMVERVAKSKRAEKVYSTTKTPVPKFPSSPMVAFGRVPGTGTGIGTGAGAITSTPDPKNMSRSSGNNTPALRAGKAGLTPAAQRLWERVGMSPRASVPAKSSTFSSSSSSTKLSSSSSSSAPRTSSDLKNMWTPIHRRKK